MGMNYLQWRQLRKPFILGAVLCLLIVGTGGTVLAHVEETPEARPSSPSTSSSLSSPEEAGLQAACWFVTIPYGAVKVAYAIGGGIVGGLAWVMTGGDTEVAQSVWIPSMIGDYIVQPQHLTGEKPLRFVGVTANDPPS
ncbi:MAG: hypothetical protein OEV71_16225 [Nitrospira sp.]|nr:hypothetical protein [Nitrospira sp.]